MAGLKPFFLTGANAKIVVNGKTLAFVTSLSYSIQVKHATPKVLGMYEASAIEPLGYEVNGSFSVIRYIADVASDIKGNSPHGIKNNGNGIGTWGSNKIIELDTGSNGRADQDLIPSKLEKATTFNIEVYQKFEGGQRSVAKIRDVRITRADFNLSKKSLANQTFNFSALYVDEDSFLADFSGNGQQFS